MRRAVLLALASVAAGAHAQQDTSRVNPLDRVVVTAERVRTPLSATSASVARIGAEELMRVPHATIADVLRLVPGFAIVDFDGMGHNPQFMVRGFYGGGEAEYAVVMVDGLPVNQLHTGLVAWDALPPVGAIEAVEIVRGSVSPLYGDAALGAVINIVTRRDAAARLRWNVAGGSRSTWQGGADVSGLLRGRAAASLAVDRTAGFRAHSERASARVRATLDVATGDWGRVALGLTAHNRDFDEPGPLLDSLVMQDRAASDPLFRFDQTRDRALTLHLASDRRVATRARLRGSLLGEVRDVSAVRTLALAPGFGDTRARDATASRGNAVVQLEIADAAHDGQLTVGAELTRGMLESRYYEIVTGDRDAYAAAGGARGDLSASGDALRIAGALFTHYALRLLTALRLSLGARADWMRDAFEPHVPAAERVTASHASLSPKAGLNIRYLESVTASGHLYLAASRSFKAPTLDQLFDQRPIPVPFPPFSLTTSNATLAPQHGVSVEAGFAHSLLAAGSRPLNISASIYQMDMKNELDFDVQTLRYVNIGRSRHRGVEAGFSVSAIGPWSTFANYTLQAATLRVGELAGNTLKAIPRHLVSGGLGFSPSAPFDVRLVATHSREMFLDDANTRTLPNYTRVDAQLAYHIRGVEAMLQVRNLLDATFNSTGFLDPSGSGQTYFHPAAGRVLLLGIRSGS